MQAHRLASDIVSECRVTVASEAFLGSGLRRSFLRGSEKGPGGEKEDERNTQRETFPSNALGHRLTSRYFANSVLQWRPLSRHVFTDYLARPRM